MFERFTERARQVVVLAQEEARILKHNYEMNSKPYKRSLRCRLFGCKPHKACRWGARCTVSCLSTCRRCNRHIIPKAKLLR